LAASAVNVRPDLNSKKTLFPAQTLMNASAILKFVHTNVKMKRAPLNVNVLMVLHFMKMDFPVLIPMNVRIIMEVAPKAV
jgi:hypothetical protein